MKLLLVEPSLLIRKRLAAMLASLGCIEIFETTAVEQASRVMHATQPDIVVMNMQLPDENGLGELVRARTEYPSACLIVMSSNATEPYRKRWLQAGADHCFDLSAHIDQLLNIVARHS